MSGKPLYTVLLLACLVLGVSAGFVLNLAVTSRENVRMDMSKGSPTTLSPATKEFLAALAEPVKVTYLVTERRRMPTALRNVEGDMRVILREMKRYGKKNFTYEVIHPEDNPQITRTVGRYHLSSFQYKTILKDEYSVDTVWSGILIEYKGETRSIPYITRDHLLYVSDRVITHIQQITTGYTSGMAVYGGAGGTYSLAEKTITDFKFGNVKRFAFGPGGGVPQDADMAFILGPEKLSRADVETIRNFIADGKDVVLTLSNYAILPEAAGGDIHYRLRPIQTGALGEYLNDMGIYLDDKILLEPKHYSGMPYLPTILSIQVNFTGFRLQRGGTMFYPNAAPLSIDQVKLKKSGHACDALIFSSVDAWTLPFSPVKDNLFTAETLLNAPASGTGVETLGIVVTSDKAWEGRLFLYACADFFSDQASARGANQLYLKNLLMTFAVPTTMNSIHAGKELLPSLPAQSSSSRLLWRIIVMGIVPLLWIVVMGVKILRHQFVGTGVRKAHLRVFLMLAAGIAAGFALTAGIRALGTCTVDLTREKINTISPVTADWLKNNLTDGVTATYFVSPSDEMPLNAREMARDVETKLRALARYADGRLTVSVEAVSDTAADPALKKKLAAYGIKPFKMRMIENDRYVEKMVYSGLVFEKKGGVFEAEPVLSRANATRLEFVVVSSIKRLLEQQRPSIALVADLPHLSAGEFWELQQLEAKTLPRSEDVYSRFIGLLRNEGYAVTLYDSKKQNAFTENILIYIQPWTITDDMKKSVNRFLCAGKKVIIGTQHFYMQARKYSGRAYSVSYWPQPQFSRIDELLAPYGIELVREVFFDQSKAPIDTREQIRWGAYKRWEKRSPDAQPFIIRAIPENYDKESPITSRLSDILFVWGNRWRPIKGVFPSTLVWRPLISSTEDSWSLDWKGGFLSEDVLQNGDYFDKKQPLCVLVEGVFPNLYGTETPSAAGRLLLIGSSKLFDNEQLDTTRYDNERFILNAVADLAYGTNLARIQATGGEEAKGFGFVPPGRKLLWRFFVMGLVPVLLAAYGIHRQRKRRIK